MTLEVPCTSSSTQTSMDFLSRRCWPRVTLREPPSSQASFPGECPDSRSGSPCVSGSPAPGEGGQGDAFGRYVVPEIDVLLRVARTLVPRPADAEDLVQDTLIRAYRSIESFDGSHPRAWLLTIMRNAQINRTRRRRPELLDDPDAALEQSDEQDEHRHSPEAVVVGASFDAVVVDALDALPDRFRQVVELIDVDGLTYAEAAEAIGAPVGTVMSRLHRARTRIRNRLAAAGLAPRSGTR